MNWVEFTSLESRFTFGRYKGLTLADVMDINPEYLLWCVINIEQFLLNDSAVAEIRIVYPYFPINTEFELHREWNYEVYNQEESYDYNNEDDNDFDLFPEEEPTYERYRGSYAQDEAGYSDDDIDTIFDGDPDAYWNID